MAEVVFWVGLPSGRLGRGRTFRMFPLVKVCVLELCIVAILRRECNSGPEGDSQFASRSMSCSELPSRSSGAFVSSTPSVSTNGDASASLGGVGRLWDFAIEGLAGHGHPRQGWQGRLQDAFFAALPLLR